MSKYALIEQKLNIVIVHFSLFITVLEGTEFGWAGGNTLLKNIQETSV